LVIPNKGEYLIIKAPALKSVEILKGVQFIIPLGEDFYKVGATFGRNDFSHHITKKARTAITEKLKDMLHCDFDVMDQITGVRPTTKDRKPLLGAFPERPNLIFFSGLGTRGIMGAPWLSDILCRWILDGGEIPAEIDINRFQ